MARDKLGGNHDDREDSGRGLISVRFTGMESEWLQELFIYQNI